MSTADTSQKDGWLSRGMVTKSERWVATLDRVKGG